MSTDREGAEKLKDQGNALRASGDLEGAAASYSRALALDPDYPAALYNLGLVSRELGRPEQAEACFRRAAQLDDKDAEARIHLGSLLHARGALAEAADAYAEAVRLGGGGAAVWTALGVLRGALGDLEAGRQSLEEALRLDPDYADAQIALGNLLMEEGRLEQAIAHGRAALARFPERAELHNNLGCALLQSGRQDEAISSFRQALSLDPQLANAQLNIGDLYGGRADYARALETYSSGMRSHPEDPAFVDRALYAMQQLCDWSAFEELCARRRRNIAEHPERVTPPFSLLSIPSSPKEQLACARALSNRLCERTEHQRQRLGFGHSGQRRGRPKVGYLSADFHDHVTAYVIAEMLELHDRGRWELRAYSYGPRTAGGLRERLAGAFDAFVDVSDLSDAEAAKRIHADGIDILVDLNGYTQRARTEILALRPAPIQVNHVGFPGTMGADFIDYVILDRFILGGPGPAGFQEKPVILPGCYVPIDRKRPIARTPRRADLGLPSGGPVLCCFNQTFKILPDVFAGWMRILRAVPGSVLWLLEGHPEANRNLRSSAAAHGIEPDRLVFSKRVPPADYLGRLRAADLFLDTFPYNAHTTAADALWVGLPVLTRAGDTFASRVAGSMLTAAGLPELITNSPHEYEALAFRLARAPAERSALKGKLERVRTGAVLFDTDRFVRGLEAAYERMLALHAAGEPPQAIEV